MDGSLLRKLGLGKLATPERVDLLKIFGNLRQYMHREFHIDTHIQVATFQAVRMYCSGINVSTNQNHFGGAGHTVVKNHSSCSRDGFSLGR